jgi:hypothetical protein
VTADDLFILVPWLLFAASVGIIVFVVRRRRPPRPNGKSGQTSQQQPAAGTSPAQGKNPAQVPQHGRQPASQDDGQADGRDPAGCGCRDQPGAGQHHAQRADGECDGGQTARGETRASEKHRSQG